MIVFGQSDHSPSENTVFGRIFYTIHPKITRPKPEIAKKRGVFPSEFRDFSDFWHNCPAVALDEPRNAAAEGDGSSDVVMCLIGLPTVIIVDVPILDVLIV